MTSSNAGLSDITHLLIVIGVLAIVIILLGAGKGLGSIARRWLIGGKSDDEGDRCIIDPSLKCPDHRAEKERSLRNEKEISQLWEKYNELMGMMTKEIRNMGAQVGQGIATLHANQLKLMIALIETKPELKNILKISPDVLNLGKSVLKEEGD
jgi:hypothetical protein